MAFRIRTFLLQTTMRRVLLCTLILALCGSMVLHAQPGYTWNTFGAEDSTLFDLELLELSPKQTLLSANHLELFAPTPNLGKPFAHVLTADGNPVDRFILDTFSVARYRTTMADWSNNGLYAAGNLGTSLTFPEEGYITRYDTAGSLLWARTYEPGKPIGQLSMAVDTGLLIAGTREYAETTVYWIDPAGGDTLKSRTYSLGVRTELFHMEAHPDGAVTLWVTLQDLTAPGIESRLGIISVNADGSIAWTNSVPRPSGGYSIMVDGVLDADGGPILVGRTNDFADLGMQVAKFDAAGAVVYDTIYILPGGTLMPRAAAPYADGVVVIMRDNSIPETVLLAVDANGDIARNVEWMVPNDAEPMDLLPLDGGGLILAGNYDNGSTIDTPNIDAFVMRLDSSWATPDCFLDCVWPGDADADGDADIFDLLPIGVAFGETGPARAGASLTWEGQESTDWTGALFSGSNYKHIDTDGNGVVNDDDTLALDLNFGLTRPLRPTGRASGDLPLYLVFDRDSAFAGDTVTLRVMLGVDTMPATNVLGVALEILHDPGLVDTIVGMTFDGSWLDPTTGDFLTMARRSVDGRADLGQTRTNGIAASGFGPIASVKYVLDDDLGGRGLDWADAAFAIRDARILDPTGTDILYDPQAAQMTVGFESTSTGLGPSETALEVLMVHPNPVLQSTAVDIPGVGQLALYDATGRMLGAWAVFAGRRNLDCSTLPSGTYLLQWTGEKGGQESIRWAKILKP
jgi:hypothetical protein